MRTEEESNKATPLGGKSYKITQKVAAFLKVDVIDGRQRRALVKMLLSGSLAKCE